MDSWLMFFSAALAISCFLPNSHALPRELELRRCGDGLANMMALVCKGRGYNSFFPDPSSGRIRRGIGIVDECCRSSCSLSTVLQYCGPLTSTEAPTDAVIKKRSDSDTDWAVETNSEGVEMLTYKPRTLQTDNEKLPKNYYGVKTSEQRQTFEEISNSIQKLSSSTPTSSSSSSPSSSSSSSSSSSDDSSVVTERQEKFNTGLNLNSIFKLSPATEKHSSHEKLSHHTKTNPVLSRLRVSSNENRSKEERRSSSKEERRSSSKEEKRNSSKEDRRLGSRERVNSRCNSIRGCRVGGGGRSSGEVGGGVDRRDLDAIRPVSIDRVRGSEERRGHSSSEQNRIRHRNHKISSREKKSSSEDKPKQSKVGTVAPFWEKGLVLPNFKTSSFNLR